MDSCHRSGITAGRLRHPLSPNGLVSKSQLPSAAWAKRHLSGADGSAASVQPSDARSRRGRSCVRTLGNRANHWHHAPVLGTSRPGSRETRVHMLRTPHWFAPQRGHAGCTPLALCSCQHHVGIYSHAKPPMSCSAALTVYRPERNRPSRTRSGGSYRRPMRRQTGS